MPIKCEIYCPLLTCADNFKASLRLNGGMSKGTPRTPDPPIVAN